MCTTSRLLPPVMSLVFVWSDTGNTHDVRSVGLGNHKWVCGVVIVGTLSDSMGLLLMVDSLSDSVDGFVATGGDNVKIICSTPPALVSDPPNDFNHNQSFPFQVKTGQ